MDLKRVTLICGHYGCGKTNVAVNLAMQLRKKRSKVAIADLDIVNPYFRTADSHALLQQNGIRLIASAYASSALDLPALPQEMYSITEDSELSAVIDIGGDDRGAIAMGRWRDALTAEHDYEMLYVFNMYRPLTRDAASALEIMREIEAASGIYCTHIVNNSNLGIETTRDDVLSSHSYAEELCALTGLPLKMTTVNASLYPQLQNSIEDLFPLDLQPGIL